MDPKNSLANAKISTEDAIDIVDDWIGKGKKYHWNEVDVEIDLRSFGDTITYWDAVKILDSYHTGKLTPECNAGFAWIKEEWKKLAKENIR